MASLRTLLYAYVAGGLTFIPLCIGLFLVFAYYTLPEPKPDDIPPKDDPRRLLREGDEKVILKTGTDGLAEKFHRKHETDVAAGYFAVCREYNPGAIGKPPEKITTGNDVVANESPSVYQTMYRSIFERNQKPTIEPTKDASGKVVRKGNYMFYVVLRHGHLMLYDDIQQLEVRYVISLDHHDVDIYGGGEEIPESELWIKRNAIRLIRKQGAVGDKALSLPFFIFSDNLSEKEDFYFAILHNIQKSITVDPPIPQEFEVADIITLVQRLHSSEERLQTRWLNAMVGRWFLAMYKTPKLEDLIRQKLTKKIARVKKPNFITKLALQKIDLGTGAPFVTNPRLKDLTVNGDCTVETDVKYSGNFRIEIAATVRIDLGARLKAREVDLVLAVTCKKLDGHVLVRFKPPPSNRVWIAFEKLPKVDLALEPIVSSRQITYGVILRTIESRIMEVVAETIVLPFWDDVPFFDTTHEKFRGGIWKKEEQPTETTEIEDEAPEDETDVGDEGTKTPDPLMRDDRILSMPVLSDHKRNSALAAARKSVTSLKEVIGTDGSKTPEKPSSRDGPRILRSPSFAASVADPMVSPNHAPAESSILSSEATSKRDSMLKDLSLRPLGTSPESGQDLVATDETPVSETSRPRTPSAASKASTDVGNHSRKGSTDSQNTLPASVATSNTADSLGSNRSLLQEDLKQKSLAAAAKQLTGADRQKALASINAATAAAQKWGWGVLARNRQKEAEAKSTSEQEPKLDTSQPMGRGQPLPPPGQPLPRPQKASMFSMPKRVSTSTSTPPSQDKTPPNGVETPKESPPKPPLPERRRRQSAMQSIGDQDDELLVVAAPDESAPSTPMETRDEHHDDFFGHGEQAEASQNSEEKKPPPPLPARPETIEEKERIE